MNYPVKRFWTVWLVMTICHFCADSTNTSKETSVLDGLLRRHDKRFRPNFGGAPIEIRASLLIMSIIPIDEVAMEFTTVFYLRQEWVDTRLAYGHLLPQPNLSFTGDFVDEFWLPDTFFESDMNDHIPRVEKLLRIYRNGNIFYSVRKKVRSYCPMEFYNFPFDEQICEISFESYAYTTKDAIYVWKHGNTDSLLLSDRLKIPQYTLIKRQLSSRINPYLAGTSSIDLLRGQRFCRRRRLCMFDPKTSADKSSARVWRSQKNGREQKLVGPITEKYLSYDHIATFKIAAVGGDFSSLIAEFVVKRKVGFHLMQTYLPSALIVVISWVAFWIDERSVPARITLAITTVLAITTLFFGVQSSLPRVGHVKAVDIFLFGNFFFVFGALIEYAVICYVTKRISRENNKKASGAFKDGSSNCKTLKWNARSTKLNSRFPGFEDTRHDNCVDEAVKYDVIQNNADKLPSRKLHKRLSVDEIARVLFPAAYAVFLLVYTWVYVART